MFHDLTHRAARAELDSLVILFDPNRTTRAEAWAAQVQETIARAATQAIITYKKNVYRSRLAAVSATLRCPSCARNTPCFHVPAPGHIERIYSN